MDLSASSYWDFDASESPTWRSSSTGVVSGGGEEAAVLAGRLGIVKGVEADVGAGLQDMKTINTFDDWRESSLGSNDRSYLCSLILLLWRGTAVGQVTGLCSQSCSIVST